MNIKEKYVDPGLSKFFSYIYQNVAYGLLLAGAVSFVISSSPSLMRILYGTPLIYVVLFSPLIISFYLGYNLQKITTQTAQNLYWLVAGSIGASMSSIFLIYTASSIASAFFVAGGVFFGAAAYGRATSTDLSKMGNILFIALIGLIISSVVNMFMQNSQFSLIISSASIVIFTGLLAYENQSLQNLYYSRINQDQMEKLAVLGSLNLFISFINIFLALLNLFGTRRD